MLRRMSAYSLPVARYGHTAAYSDQSAAADVRTISRLDQSQSSIDAENTIL